MEWWESLWRNFDSKMLGCFRPSRYIYAEIVDYCPNCTSTINLSRYVFSAIADLNAGRIKIKYGV